MNNTYKLNNKLNKIIVQGALKDEIDSLICKMPGGISREIHGYEFYETTEPETGGKIIISLTGMGIMNACIATQLGICNYAPECIINQGTAGGHTTEMHI